MTPAPETVSRSVEHRIAAVLGVLAFAAVRLTSTRVGFVRDEGYYFKAAEEYVAWYRSLAGLKGGVVELFSRAATDRFFNYNHEHPALIKTAQGMSWWIWHEVLGIGLNSEGFRLPGPLSAALCVGITYLLGQRMHGRFVGLFAAVAWMMMPRNYFDSHLACFDVPITAMTILAVHAYVRWDGSWKATLWAGVAFGLCMATKHNSLFIPPLLVMHWLATGGANGFKWKGTSVSLPPVPTVFLALAVVGPAVFLLHWPWLWHDTFQRIGGYYGYHFLSHEHYPQSYYGALLRQPPFPVGYAFGMTLVTTPLPLLGLQIAGLGLAVRDGFFLAATSPQTAKRRGDAWILGLFGLFPMVVISLPSTPIFGGIKHFMPATPFLCIMAGMALEWGFRSAGVAVERTAWRAWAGAAAFLLTAFLGIVRSEPHGIGYYNELVGGARGAANIGFQRVFWGVASRPIMPVINSATPQGGRVFFNRTNHDGYRMYVKDGLLRTDIQYANTVQESVAGVSFHQWEHEGELYNMWNMYGNRWPLTGAYLEGGVPLTQFYLKQR